MSLAEHRRAGATARAPCRPHARARGLGAAAPTRPRTPARPGAADHPGTAGTGCPARDADRRWHTSAWPVPTRRRAPSRRGPPPPCADSSSAPKETCMSPREKDHPIHDAPTTHGRRSSTWTRTYSSTPTDPQPSVVHSHRTLTVDEHPARPQPAVPCSGGERRAQAANAASIRRTVPLERRCRISRSSPSSPRTTSSRATPTA